MLQKEIPKESQPNSYLNMVNDITQFFTTKVKSNDIDVKEEGKSSSCAIDLIDDNSNDSIPASSSKNNHINNNNNNTSSIVSSSHEINHIKNNANDKNDKSKTSLSNIKDFSIINEIQSSSDKQSVNSSMTNPFAKFAYSTKSIKSTTSMNNSNNNNNNNNSSNNNTITYSKNIKHKYKTKTNNHTLSYPRKKIKTNSINDHHHHNHHHNKSSTADINIQQLSLSERKRIRLKWQKFSNPKDTLENRRYHVFVAARLHARAQESVIHVAMKQLFDSFPPSLTVHNIANCDEEQLSQWISNVHFANSKSKQIIKASKMIIDQFDGKVPECKLTLQTLTGIGPKLADILSYVNTRDAYLNDQYDEQNTHTKNEMK